jgi:single-stranded-DNA-specific exonuclease
LVAAKAPDAFLQSLIVHPLVGQVLYNRGLRTANEVQTFLNAPESPPSNPNKIPDMMPAVQRIVQAIRFGERICVYGNSDVDGIAATSVLVAALQATGANAQSYIPDRLDECCGIDVAALARSVKARLLITVACGSRSLEEVDILRRRAMDVIVTDHHTISGNLPLAWAVVNPQRVDFPSDFKHLAGVGVAYRLAQAVLHAEAQASGRVSPNTADSVEESLLDLVALGTIAAGMPLQGENRALVRRGLKKINHSPRLGLAELMRVTDLVPGAVDSTAVSLRLVPSLRAAGRLDRGPLAYDLLCSTRDVQAYSQARTLLDINQWEHKFVREALERAERILEHDLEDNAPLLIAESPHFYPGILGLVAEILVNRFHRPVLMLRTENEIVRGSARSVPGFDIFRGLSTASKLLLRYGGHSFSAGFTLQSNKLPDLRQALSALAVKEFADHENLRLPLHIDAEIRLQDLSSSLVEQFLQLEPTGEANPPPVLLARGCKVLSVQTGDDDKHIKLDLESGQTSQVIQAIAPKRGEWNDLFVKDRRLDIVFKTVVSKWQGAPSLKLNIEDLCPATV